jgi:hypothetical protein
MRSAPVAAGDPERALAYVADAEGNPEEAILRLQQAEEDASRHERPLSAAIARYQRGRRLGGTTGERLQQFARDAVGKLGAAEALLDEDPALR